MRYALIEDNEIVKVDRRPRWFHDSGVELTDAELADHGWHPVQQQERPEHDPYFERLELDPPVLDQGTVTQEWRVLSLPQEEIDRLRADAQARIDDFNAFVADLEARKEALAQLPLRAAFTPIYDEMILRKRRELRVDEAEAILNPERT